MSLVLRSTQQGGPSGQGVSRATNLVTSVVRVGRCVASRATADGNASASATPLRRTSVLKCFYNEAIMSEGAMYSKTRLGSDQIEGALSLSPRGKRIVYLVVALVVAAGAAIGIWSAVSNDPLATSANG